MDQTSTPGDSGTERMESARQAVAAGRFDEALQAYDWLWRHLLEQEPTMVGVRISFLAADIGQLCQRSPEARRHFQQLRDDTEPLANGAEPAALVARLDWLVLNEIVDETDRSLAWFDTGQLASIGEPHFSRLRRRLVDPLRQRGRYADIGRLFPDAVNELQSFHQILTQADLRSAGRPEAERQESREAMRQLLRDQAGLFARSLRAAERNQLAEQLVAVARSLDDSPEMAAALS